MGTRGSLRGHAAGLLGMAAACGGAPSVSAITADASVKDAPLSHDAPSASLDSSVDGMEGLEGADGSTEVSGGADGASADSSDEQGPPDSAADAGVDAPACPVFRPSVSYPADSAIDVRSADFNGDTVLDLAVASISGATGTGVSVLLGNGDGTFGAATNFPALFGSMSLIVADLNADGNVDIATALFGDSQNQAAIAILLGKGDGTFLAAVDYPFGAPSYVFLESADLNRDGVVDLVVTRYSSSDDVVAVLVGNGDGTFRTPVLYDVGASPVGIAADDFNGDGAPDIAVLVGGAVDVLLGNGDGTLKQPVAYRSAGRSAVTAVGDVNGDGFKDLATDGIFVLLGVGDGTFGAQTFAGPGGVPAPADFNGDGVIDFGATASARSAWVLFRQDDGTSVRSAKVSIPTDGHSSRAGDFDGDGRPDLVVTNSGLYSVSILLNSGLCWEGGSGDGGADAHDAGGGG